MTFSRRPGISSQALKTAALLALALLSLGAAPAPPAPGLDALRGRDVEGEPWSADDLAGQVVLVDFWATWCAPCLADLPALRELRAAHAGDGFEVVGVSLDTLPRRELRSWLARHRVSWPQLYDGRGFEGDVARSFGVDRVPRSFLFDRRGRLVAVDLTAEARAAAVAALLELSAEPPEG